MFGDWILLNQETCKQHLFLVSALGVAMLKFGVQIVDGLSKRREQDVGTPRVSSRGCCKKVW